MPQLQTTQKGAEELAKKIFGEEKKNLGSIGLGKRTYYVYMYVDRSEWTGPTFHLWQSSRVSWKWNYGRPLEGKVDGE